MGNITGKPSRFLVTMDNGNLHYSNAVGSKWGNTWEAHDVQGQAAYNQAARQGLVNPAEDATPIWQRQEMLVDLVEEPVAESPIVDDADIVKPAVKLGNVRKVTKPSLNFAGGVQRGWKGTRGAISEDNMAKLKEMGFTGTTARDAQKWMNDNFALNGMFGYKVATDNAWGDQSLRNFDLLYKNWQANRPEQLKAVEKPEEPVVDAPNPYEPKTFNTDMTFNKGNIRANRGVNYSNVDELWNHVNTNQDSTEAKLFGNVFGGLNQDLKKQAFYEMMNKYKIKGNLGRRDSGRVATLFNDLNMIGTKGSDARNAYINSFNQSFQGAKTLGEQPGMTPAEDDQMTIAGGIQVNKQDLMKMFQ